MRKKAEKVTVFKKAVNYVGKNGIRRTTLGISLCIGSLLYMVVLSDVSVKRDLCGNFLYLIDALAFIVGMRIFTQNYDRFTRIMNRGCLESAGFILAAASAKGIMDALATPFTNLTGLNQLLIFAAVLYLSWYLIRLERFMFKFIKKIITKIVKMVKGKEMKNETELINAVFENLISIAGKMALLYKVVEPLINKILGI